MTLEAALRSFLIADSTIFATVTNRVYVGHAPVNTSYPCIVISLVGDSETDKDLTNAYEESLQITCRAEDDEYNDINGYSNASNLAKIVKYAMRSQAVRGDQWTDSDDNFNITDATYRGSRMIREDNVFDCPLTFDISYTMASV